MEDAEIARRLDESWNVHAHRHDPVRHELQKLHDRLAGRFGQRGRRGISAADGQREAGVGDGVLRAERRFQPRDARLHRRELRRLHGEDGAGRGRDGVVLQAALRRDDAQRNDLADGG